MARDCLNYTQGSKSTCHMANKIPKSLAVAAGMGVALGFSASLSRRRKSEAPSEPSDHGLDEHLQHQAQEIKALRAEVDDSARRASAEFAAVERHFADARAELPAAIEAVVIRRVEDLRTRLHSEMRDGTDESLARMDRAIEEKLASRIETIETTLGDQSGAIGSLNRRALETDANLQKLIASVELLCDRVGARPASTLAVEPSFLELPFQAEYKAALQNEPTSPIRFVPAFRPAEKHEKAERPRIRAADSVLSVDTVSVRKNLPIPSAFSHVTVKVALVQHGNHTWIKCLFLNI